MRALIEISGNADDCEVVPTCGRSYTYMNGGEYSVNLDLVMRAGYGVFLHLPSCVDITPPYIAFGMDTCVQVKLKYPWTKHNIVSNVPINTYCEKGYAESIFDVIYHRIKDLITT